MRLVDSIEMNTKHYVDIMSKAVDAVMPTPNSDVRYVAVFVDQGKYLANSRPVLKMMCSMC